MSESLDVVLMTGSIVNRATDAVGLLYGFQIYIGRKTLAVSDFIYPSKGAAEQLGAECLAAFLRSEIYDEIING